MSAPRIRILPFETGDLAMLRLRPEQAGDAAMLGSGGDTAAQLGPAYTIVDCPENQRDMRVLCCGGLAVNGPDHATAWALLADGIAPGQWGRIIRAMRGVLDAADYRRIDMAVRHDWPAAQRFAAALGFAEDYRVMRRVFHEERSTALQEAA